MKEAKIRDLQIQPLKGGGPLSLTEARMTEAGLETLDGQIRDHFLVAVTATIDHQGFHNFLTQRVQIDPNKNLLVPGSPLLSLARPESRNGHLVLNFNGQGEIEDPGEVNDDPSRVIPVQVWEYRGDAIEIPTLSEWLSDNLQRNLKVARTSGPWNRRAKQNFMPNDNKLRSQDGYPIHAISWEDAVAVFEALGVDVDANRFRYQVLLEGLNFREIHEYYEVRIDEVAIFQAKPCDRCEVTGIDQETGEFSKVKPLAGISKLGVGRWIRPDNGKKVHIVGENWLPQGGTIIREGEEVVFTHLREVPLAFEDRAQTT